MLGTQLKVTAVLPTRVLTAVPLGAPDRPGKFLAKVKPIGLEPPVWIAEATWARLLCRLYGAGRPPSREKPGPPRSLITPLTMDRASVLRESPPPPEAINAIGPYWLSSSASLARTLRTASTTGRWVPNTATMRVRP